MRRCCRQGVPVIVCFKNNNYEKEETQMKELTWDESVECRGKYMGKAKKLVSQRMERDEPYLDGTASYFFKCVPFYVRKQPILKEGYTLLFHFKLNPNCEDKPTGFIVCCFQKNDKYFLTKHKAGNCPCWEKGYAD
jgi:hypothetical protein